MEVTEEIKARLSIEDVVSEYVPLKKAGRNLTGLCPFHSDSKPSLMVSQEKGIAWCFACQNGGDIFKFIELIEGVDFSESLKILADKAGVILKSYDKKSSQVHKDKKKRLEACMEAAMDFYIQELKSNEGAQKYWNTREIKEQVSKSFQIGYAPDSFQKTFDYLKDKGFHSEEIVQSGLGIEKEQSPGEFFDRFRKRIMMPIKDHLGHIVGFGGRIIEASDKQAKYLNSPETDLYNKSCILFGLDRAKEEIKKQDSVVILEGYMDVIASHQADLKNVVAVSGTALTENQLKLIKRYTNNIKLCFDQDPAGKDATKRSIELALEQGFRVEVVLLENAKDCDELIKKGEEHWLQAVQNPISSFAFFSLELEQHLNIESPDEQKQYMNKMFQVVCMYKGTVLQQNYIKNVAEKCRMNNKLILDEFLVFQKEYLKNSSGASYKKSSVAQSAKSLEVRRFHISLEEYVLGILFSYPHFILLLKDILVFQVFTDEKTKDIYKKLMDNYDSEANLEDLYHFFSGELLEKIKIWQLYSEEKNEYFTEEEYKEEIEVAIKNLNAKNLKKAEELLVQRIRQDLSPEAQKEIAVKMMELSKLKKNVEI
ncbi:DNA primase [Candidatus Peregrinibacteria bacterium]|jgi:DNA primase|nr:DNA primase [Candidatus Peregrinibacteria bacterium]